MTYIEKEQIRNRLERAGHLERTFEIAVDACLVIDHPEWEDNISDSAERVWSAIKAMPTEYRLAILDVVKKWSVNVNKEYEEL